MKKLYNYTRLHCAHLWQRIPESLYLQYFPSAVNDEDDVAAQISRDRS